MADSGAPQVKRLKPRPETASRRIEIIDAAAEVFGAKGYSDATLAEIGERVGMTRAGVLHHFGSKKDLLIEAVNRRDVTDLSPFDPENRPHGMDLFEHFIESATRNHDRPGIIQAFVVLSAEALTDASPIRGYFTDRYRSLRGEVAEELELLCAERGIDDPAGVRHSAAAIVALMDGVQYQWLLEPDRIELVAATEYGIRTILRQLLGDPVLGPRIGPSAD